MIEEGLIQNSPFRLLDSLWKEKLDVDIIIPTLNEEKNISSVIDKCLKYTDSILIIDGNSTDNTVKVAESFNVRVMSQSGVGKGAAMREALEHVDGDIVIFLDGDGSMRPEEIPIFVNGILSGADIVKGSRMVHEGGSDDITFLRRFGNWIFVAMVNYLCNSNFTDLCYGYLAFRKSAALELLPKLRSTGFNIETEIIIKAKKLGLKIIEVPSFEGKRLYGKSKLNCFRDGLKILFTILRESVT